MMYDVPYVRIGLQFLGLIAFIVAVMFWIHAKNYSACKCVYDVHFKTSISGLRKGDPVNYKGVEAGRVQDIFIHPKEHELIVVRICLLEGFPVKVNTMAQIETRSIAGGSILSLEGGTKDAPALASADKNPPIIFSRESQLEQITNALPQIFSRIEEFLLHVTPDKGDVKQFMKNLNRILEPKDVREVMRLLRVNLKHFSTIQQKLIGLLDDNQVNVQELFSSGIRNFNQFLLQGTEAMKSLQRVADSIERSPGRFFHNDPSKGVKLS